MAKFWDKAEPTKIGTIPMLVVRDKRVKLEVGKWIRVRYVEGGLWEHVYVTRVDDNGYWTADK